MKQYAAVDLGASNGRMILGGFDGKTVKLQEINRFVNNYTRVGDGYYWDILYIYNQITEGLRKFVNLGKGELISIGIDSWGVDFGLLDKQGRLVGIPHAYRDPRGESGQKAFYVKYGKRAAFDISGIANLEFNTLYQLYYLAITKAPELQTADKLLMIPDLLGYMLSGVVSTEYTNATTTQMLDSHTGGWSRKLIEMAKIPASIFTGIQMSGQVKGELHSYIRQETGLLSQPKIICAGSHDTASAVASIPAIGDNYAFISSGTWSLMGVILNQPVINDDVFRSRLSNEGTVCGSVRLLKNIMGLWIIQNCKREWERGQNLSWVDITRLAQKATAFRSFIDVNAHEFFRSNNMPEKIQQFCKSTGQPVPQSIGELARSVYESLAMSYRDTFFSLENLRGSRIDILHIVGGGSLNKMLNQFTANAVNRVVISGLAEATAVGNIMMQVYASGEVKNASEMRQVIYNSFEMESYVPCEESIWNEQYERYRSIMEKSRINLSINLNKGREI